MGSETVYLYLSCVIWTLVLNALLLTLSIGMWRGVLAVSFRLLFRFQFFLLMSVVLLGEISWLFLKIFEKFYLYICKS